MAEAEQASLLGELATTRGPAGASSMTDKGVDAGSSIEHNKVKEIRTWIKGIRDAGYGFLSFRVLNVYSSRRISFSCKAILEIDCRKL